MKVVKRYGGWEVWGSMEVFNGLLSDFIDLVKFMFKWVVGIYVCGGIIIKIIN